MNFCRIMISAWSTHTSWSHEPADSDPLVPRWVHGPDKDNHPIIIVWHEFHNRTQLIVIRKDSRSPPHLVAVYAVMMPLHLNRDTVRVGCLPKSCRLHPNPNSKY